MKRFFAAVLALVLVCLFAQALGADPSDLRGYDDDKGYQYLEMGTYYYGEDGTTAPVKWRILFVEGQEALILTENIIDVHQIIEVDDFKVTEKRRYRNFTKFRETDMYTWMHGEMLEKMCEEQDFRSALIEQENGLLYFLTMTDYRNTDYGFPRTLEGCTIEYEGQGAHKEAWRRVAYGTPYAKSHQLYDDWTGKTKKLFVGRDTGGSPYWTRSLRDPEGKGFFMGIIGKNGHLSWSGFGSVFVGVRPAGVLNLERIEIAGGSGTEADPWKLTILP